MTATNLPAIEIKDSAAGTKLFFDTYGDAPLEFNSIEVDTCLAFFMKNGFEEDAAIVTSAALIKQAKIENIPIFRILDSLKVLEGVQLSALVTEILNNNRSPSSTLGYRQPTIPAGISRNIHA